MAALSYVWPSAATTGSVIITCSSSTYCETEEDTASHTNSVLLNGYHVLLSVMGLWLLWLLIPWRGATKEVQQKCSTGLADCSLACSRQGSCIVLLPTRHAHALHCTAVQALLRARRALPAVSALLLLMVLRWWRAVLQLLPLLLGFLSSCFGNCLLLCRYKLSSSRTSSCSMSSWIVQQQLLSLHLVHMLQTRPLDLILLLGRQRLCKATTLQQAQHAMTVVCLTCRLRPAATECV